MDTVHVVRHWRLLRDKSRHCHRAVCAAVEGPLKCDDLTTPRGRLAQLQRSVNGVCSRRAAELDLHLVAHLLRQKGELKLDEFVLEWRWKVEAVTERAKLTLDRLDDLGMIVSECEDTCSRQKVDEDVRVHVLDIRSRCPRNRNRQAAWIGPCVRLSLGLSVEQTS